MNNAEQAPTRVMKETKNKIRVDFERTSFLQRMKIKYISAFFLQKVIWVIFRFVLLMGVSYVILFPFFAKITGSIMSPQDFIDNMVRMVPRNPTLNTYRGIIIENQYWLALRNTALLSFIVAICQMFVCTFIGYGFSKFKFRGNTILFYLVLFSLLVPHQTLQFSMFMKFRYFDVFGIFGLIQRIRGLETLNDTSINLINRSVGGITGLLWPIFLMSLTGLAFKNGLYVFIMRQCFKGVPDELEEAAYVDGAGVFRTYFTIVLPTVIPLMITVFLFAFTWQWTDDFYVNLFTTDTGPYLIPRIVRVPRGLVNNPIAIQASTMYQSAIRNTAGLMIIAPLLIVFLIGQRFLIQGIERTGVVG